MTVLCLSIFLWCTTPSSSLEKDCLSLSPPPSHHPRRRRLKCQTRKYTTSAHIAISFFRYFHIRSFIVVCTTFQSTHDNITVAIQQESSSSSRFCSQRVVSTQRNRQNYSVRYSQVSSTFPRFPVSGEFEWVQPLQKTNMGMGGCCNGLCKLYFWKYHLSKNCVLSYLEILLLIHFALSLLIFQITRWRKGKNQEKWEKFLGFLWRMINGLKDNNSNDIDIDHIHLWLKCIMYSAHNNIIHSLFFIIIFPSLDVKCDYTFYFLIWRHDMMSIEKIRRRRLWIVWKDWWWPQGESSSFSVYLLLVMEYSMV